MNIGDLTVFICVYSVLSMCSYSYVLVYMGIHWIESGNVILRSMSFCITDALVFKILSKFLIGLSETIIR